jgi:hypothetical protein
MPSTINGIGTAVCKAGGDIWGDSYDAMECFVFFFLPIFPYAAYHTFGWSGNQYRRVPIRFRFDLLLRTYLRAWRWPLLLIPIVVVLVLLRGSYLEWAVAGGTVVFFGCLFAGMTWGLRLLDRRTCDIRFVLGTHPLGSCDPAQLKGEAKEVFAVPPGPRFGTTRYSEAVELNLSRGSWSEAMWAARLTTAFEDPAVGEELTDLVLADPNVQAAIEAVRKRTRPWRDVMMSEEERRQEEQQQQEGEQQRQQDDHFMQEQQEQARWQEEQRRRQEDGVQPPEPGTSGPYTSEPPR